MELRSSKSKLNTKLGEDNHFYGQTHTEEAKLKMVKTKLNKTLSEKVKSKISATMTGRRLTEQQKVNLSRGPATFPLRGKSQRKIPCAARSACWAASLVRPYLYLIYILNPAQRSEGARAGLPAGGAGGN